MSRPLEPIPVDLGGKVCVVTGATAGIGKQAAWGLARLGAQVVLVGRNEARSRLARLARLMPQLLSQDAQTLARADLRYTNGLALTWAPAPKPQPQPESLQATTT